MNLRKIINGILGISLIALLNFALGLLTNYASSNVPTVFQEHPALLWGSIGFLIIFLVSLNFAAEYRKTRESMSKIVKSDKEEAVDYFPIDSTRQDVFISYSRKDAKFVDEELIPFLKTHSFTYFIDKENFRTGGASVEEMERAINTSRRVILVLTKNYFKSEWAKFENIMAQTLDPSANSRKLLPLLVEDCDLPLRLKIYHYRDLRSSQKSQWDLLARDLA